MLLKNALVGLTALVIAATAQYTTFSNRVIFTPASNFTDPRVLYARTVELSDGTLLATWENYSAEPPIVYFPIYESTDRGASWKEISRVRDTVNGWGLRYQPFLFELSKTVGKFPAGTIILSGNSIPTNLSKTQIDVYASQDKGRTWEFVSHVAAGGVARPVNSESPVWEPFMLMDGDDIILYYADQRDTRTGQTTAHQTSKDLVNWTPVVNDAIYSDPAARPGMPVVTKLPNGEYFFAYEYGGAPGSSGFPIHYRMAADPRQFASARDYAVVGQPSNRVPTSCPYAVWTSWGGADGTIILSAYQGEIWTNKQLGNPSAWRVYSVPQPSAYTRSLLIFKDQPNMMLLMGAGQLPPSTTNRVSLSVVDLNQIIT